MVVGCAGGAGCGGPGGGFVSEHWGKRKRTEGRGRGDRREGKAPKEAVRGWVRRGGGGEAPGPVRLRAKASANGFR